MIEAVLLGLLQGVAEFLPISSSGHLMLLKHWFGLAELPIIFDLALHVATLGAVLLVFHKTIFRLILVLWRVLRRSMQPGDDQDLAYIGIIVLATVLTAGIGLALKDLEVPLVMVYAGFVYTAMMLIMGSFFVKSQQMLDGKLKTALVDKGVMGKVLTAMVVGLLQGLAVLPGISRSGSTITGALFCGVSRDRAGEMSFLLSIPAILGGFILTLHEGQGEQLLSQMSFGSLIVAFVTAFFSGWLALVLLLKLIKEMKLHYFAFYLIPMAALGMAGILP